MAIAGHQKHAAEARFRIAKAAALNPAAAGQKDMQEVAFSGARAHFWLIAAVGRVASARFIADLCRDFGTATVLSAAVEMCKTGPIGPMAWLRHRIQAIQAIQARPIVHPLFS